MPQLSVSWHGSKGYRYKVRRFRFVPLRPMLFYENQKSMSNYNYAPGAIHIDHHRDITINANGTNAADLLRAALAEDVEPVEDEGDFFKFIHPSVTSLEEKKQISEEIKNLVRSLPLPEICRYLRQMYKDKRVYLNVKTDAMFDELHRMGMPDESVQGFSQKNFQNYFNIND